MIFHDTQNLVLGISPTSEGFACATNADVDAVVVKRAKHIKKCLVDHKPIDAIVTDTASGASHTPLSGLKLVQEFLSIDNYMANDAETNTAIDKILMML